MILFTKYNMIYAFVACFMFGVTVGFVMYSLSRDDSICPTYFSKTPRGHTLCYFGISGAAGGLAGIIWPAFKSPWLKAYISLTSIAIANDPFNFLMTVKAYMEMIKVLQHFMKAASVPLDVSECIKEEVTYSVALVRRSLFSESHVEKMNRGITDVAASFNQVQKAQDAFRDAIEKAFKWLESRGMTCEQTLLQPGIECRANIEHSERCLKNSGLYELIPVEERPYKCMNAISLSFYRLYCGAVGLIGNAVCGVFSQEAITNFLLRLRDMISVFVSQSVRMRAGIHFEMHSTGYVEDELSNAWAPFKKAMNSSGGFLTMLYNWLSLYGMTCVALIIFITPIFYILYYNRGPLDFDNRYIPEEEVEKDLAERTDETEDEVKYLPLQVAEMWKLQMAPAWIPNPPEIVQLVRSLLGNIDIILMALLYITDYYLTFAVDFMYFWSINLFNRYQGNIFDYVHDPNPSGLRWITQMVVEQLDKLQQAAGLGRMVACSRRAPPIDYTYDTFCLLIFTRLLRNYFKIKMAWIPSMICARYNPRRHQQRMRSLKAKTLLRRQYYEEPPYFLWLHSFSMTFCSFCRMSLPGWLDTIVRFRESFNI